jgi:hypothetical protein
MQVELIPVIELGYNNQDVASPDKYPYWENSEFWDKYHEHCYIKAGFKDKLRPYLPGSTFIKPCDISDNNLIKLVKDHTEDYRKGEYGRQEASALYGGYVLRINGEDMFFPQCCGDLADIEYWDRLSKGRQSYYEGHPAPQVEINKDSVILDFSVDEFEEPFQPTPSETRLGINLQALKTAVEKAKTELEEFAIRLNKINQNEDLKIQNIAGLLIWENANFK